MQTEIYAQNFFIHLFGQNFLAKYIDYSVLLVLASTEVKSNNENSKSRVWTSSIPWINSNCQSETRDD